MTGRRLKEFTPTDRSTWKALYERQDLKRDQQVISIFSEGLKALGIRSEDIPDLDAVNQILMKKTGFQGVPVDGLEGPHSFFKMLAEGKFPVGNFVRDPKDLSYTPAPDIFHDLYGHIPFLADPAYADSCQKIGEAASEFFGDLSRLRQFERFFWFTFEFGLVRTAAGLRIFGAGIASSIGECHYALSGRPRLVEFDLDQVRFQEFRIDEMQQQLFVLEHETQLYGCIEEFVDRVRETRCSELQSSIPVYRSA